MLNVAILEEDGQKVKVEVSIQPRTLDREQVIVYQSEQIKQAVKELLKEKYKNKEFVLPRKVRKLINLHENSRTSQIVEATFKKKDVKVKKKKSNHKVKPGESSGSSKS